MPKHADKLLTRQATYCNVTLRRVRVSSVMVQKQYVLGTVIAYVSVVCGLSYQTCNGHAPYCIVICGLSGSTIFFHIISYKGTIFEIYIYIYIERKMHVFSLSTNFV